LRIQPRSGNQSLDAGAAQTIARGYSPEDLRKPLEQLGSRLEAGEFARLQPWTLEQRLTMLAELQSMRDLEVVIAELNRWLAQIPGRPSKAGSPIPILQHSESGI
jgi:chromosomal replication initiation ATPase DnaA